jgi:hypothetical protein
MLWRGPVRLKRLASPGDASLRELRSQVVGHYRSLKMHGFALDMVTAVA